MTYPAHLPRPLVLRAKRETVVLVIAATTLTLALSHVVHRHRDSALARQAAFEQAWTGDLAEVEQPKVVLASAEPLTSASLVVPPSVLALPEPPLRALVKLRGCAGQSCTPKLVNPPLPVRRDVIDDDAEPAPVTVVARHTPPPRKKPGLMTRLNPLNHLPDASAIKRPFVFAGDAVTGWFKNF